MSSTAIGAPNKSLLLSLMKLMRPKQWVKNGFVFAPLLFSGQFFNGTAIQSTLLAVVLFCIASSATYVLNDILDRKRDQRHPVKSKKRPIAAGWVSVQQALLLLAGLIILLLVLGLSLQPAVLAVISAYLALNLAYSFALKHQPVIDIFVIAIGFVLRVYAGATALGVPVSPWMFVTTLCLALYLAAVKRRQELLSNGTEGRKVLEHYTVSLVDRYAEMSATGALLFYSLFVITDRPEMAITIPLVLYGIFRYWFVVESEGGGESPTDALLSDWQLMAVTLLWAGISAWALWPTQAAGA